jgi:hypothetical protein
MQDFSAGGKAAIERLRACADLEIAIHGNSSGQLLSAKSRR